METGTRLGHYEIVELLGAGGMGEVYRARDTNLKREVAIKVLPAAVAADQERLGRLEREAHLLASLNHVNIASIYSLERDADTRFLVLELVEGETLAERLQRGPLPVTEALEAGGQIAEALEAAHEKGIIHRDLKPANVMLKLDGQVKVLDFGIAKLRQPGGIGEPPDSSDVSTQLTLPGTLVGTVPYMSPERIRGQAVDRRSDIWSLGCLLYEALAGRGAYQRDTAPDTMSAILQDEPEWADLPPETPQAIRTLLRRALDKDVDRRLRDAGDARLEIEDALAELVVPARSAPGAERAKQPESPGIDGFSSVAVLPFVNMSANPEDLYFSNGITEEIINALAQLENLRVAARASCFAFKGPSPDIAEVGSKLNVETVLEGSVRRAGTRLRITAQLVNVADGFHLWSERFDREMHDVFAIQDEIAAAITDTFKVSLLGDTAASTQLRHSEDIRVYQLYLKGRYFLAQRVEGLAEAIGFYRHAVERDPQYALAHAGLAEAFTFMGIYNFLPPKEAFPEARKAASSALALDAQLAEAQLALAEINLFHDWDWAAAQRGFEKAVALRPQDPVMRLSLGYYHAVLGDPERALTLSAKAAEEDPLSLWVQVAYAMVLYLARLFEDAIAVCEKTIELDRHNSEAYRWGGRAHGLLGRWERAVEWLRQAVTLSGRNAWAICDLASTLAMSGQEDEARVLLAELEDRSAREWIPPMAISLIYANLGEIDRALDWLERSYDARGVWLVALRTDPCFDPMRSNPRFDELLDRLDFPE